MFTWLQITGINLNKEISRYLQIAGNPFETRHLNSATGLFANEGAVKKTKRAGQTSRKSNLKTNSFANLR